MTIIHCRLLDETVAREHDVEYGRQCPPVPRDRSAWDGHVILEIPG